MKSAEALSKQKPDSRPLGSPITWIRKYFEQLAENDVDVPCGTCYACCRSFDRIYLHPDEAEKYLYIKYDDGSFSLQIDPETQLCCYSVDGQCSIYEDRPLNCRQFDCRALAHCGVVPAEYPHLKDAVLSWKVELKTDGEKVMAMALRMAARTAAAGGASATQTAAQAVMGGYREFVDQARAVVKNDKILTAAKRKPKLVDSRGKPLT